MTENKSGTLYCVGVGPGDPDLVTLKAARLLRETPLVFIPQQEESGKTQALEIIRDFLDASRQEFVYLQFPITRRSEVLEPAWDLATAQLVEKLAAGQSGVFPVLGDPLLFGTFNYVLDRLNAQHPEIKVEIVPGVTSIQAASAAAGVPLAEANERIAILPALYEENPAQILQMLQSYQTVVLLKVGGMLEKILPVLERESLLARAVYAERLGLSGQRVIKGRAIADLAGQKLPYFSLLILKK